MAGNDVLTGGKGADLLDGGAGRDPANYSYGSRGVTVGLLDHHGILGIADGDEYVSVENVVGSDLNDVIGGDDQANVLVGNGGDDRLFGLRGADELFGGFIGIKGFTAPGQVRFFFEGDHTVVEVNTADKAGAEMQIQLDHHVNLAKGDFIFDAGAL